MICIHIYFTLQIVHCQVTNFSYATQIYVNSDLHNSSLMTPGEDLYFVLSSDLRNICLESTAK